MQFTPNPSQSDEKSIKNQSAEESCKVHSDGEPNPFLQKSTAEHILKNASQYFSELFKPAASTDSSVQQSDIQNPNGLFDRLRKESDKQSWVYKTRQHCPNCTCRCKECGRPYNDYQPIARWETDPYSVTYRG